MFCKNLVLQNIANSISLNYFCLGKLKNANEGERYKRFCSGRNPRQTFIGQTSVHFSLKPCRHSLGLVGSGGLWTVETCPNSRKLKQWHLKILYWTFNIKHCFGSHLIRFKTLWSTSNTLYFFYNNDFYKKQGSNFSNLLNWIKKHSTTRELPGVARVRKTDRKRRQNHTFSGLGTSDLTPGPWNGATFLPT